MMEEENCNEFVGEYVFCNIHFTNPSKVCLDLDIWPQGNGIESIEIKTGEKVFSFKKDEIVALLEWLKSD